MIKKLLYVGLPVAAADQAIKASIRRLPTGQTVFEIPGLVAVTPSFNTGAAFSLLSGRPLLLAAVSAALLLALCIYAARSIRLTRAAETALCVLIGGGVGNLIDRILYAGVTDYIRLLPFEFPIFNLADMAVTGSIAVLIILLFMGKLENTAGEEDGENH